PRAAEAGRPARYRFRAPPLEPPMYRAAYALSEGERRGVREAFKRFAGSLGFEKLDKDRFRWQAPPGCALDLHCVYEAAAARSGADLAPLAGLFRAHAKAKKLTSLEAADLVVSFVQSIHYEVPDEPFGLLAPALVASEGRGDCDSKSLLALVLLHELGIDGVLLTSDAHHHAMLGVPLPVDGTSLELAGRRYAFTECTAVGWPIGRVDPMLLHPDDWRATKVRFRARSKKKRH
ncbi:MAG TPA: hypothetical protein VHB21_07865, partial [Minicystis sp.]|nr:hypothetical protein [Minicystis sp.]